MEKLRSRGESRKCLSPTDKEDVSLEIDGQSHLLLWHCGHSYWWGEDTNIQCYTAIVQAYTHIALLPDNGQWQVSLMVEICLFVQVIDDWKSQSDIWLNSSLGDGYCQLPVYTWTIITFVDATSCIVQRKRWQAFADISAGALFIYIILLYGLWQSDIVNASIWHNLYMRVKKHDTIHIMGQRNRIIYMA